MNDELKTIISAYVYCIEHRLCTRKNGRYLRI